MDTRTITKEISNEDLTAALELYYRSMSAITRDEEIVDASYGNGIVTFTIKRVN